MKSIFALLLLASIAQAKDLYTIKALSENQIQQTYIDLLRDACHYADRDWKAAPFDSAAGYWGDGVSCGNEGIRTIGDMVLASAALVKYDQDLTDIHRNELLIKAIAGLRYMVETHRTDTQKCTDGKPWGATPRFGGESWQSGMWTGDIAFESWLIWDKLDAPLKDKIEQVISWEDDILANRKPPNGLWSDTKAEENGWEVPTLVLGELMFPSHTHAAAWHEAAIRYMMNTLCTDTDTRDTSVIDGKPVNQWVGAANIQPDFTLENHGIFHPSYVGCSSYFLTQASMYYTYAGHPIPQSALHHQLDTWHMFENMMLPWGESAYPQGMDWELHGTPYINLFASLATRDKDPFAARLEQTSLQYMRSNQIINDGSLTPPGSRLGIARHAINAEQVSYALLAHKVFGPSAHTLSNQEALQQEQGVHEFPYVQFITQRTLEKFASFSWKNRIIGLLIPLGEGHESEPYFTTPIRNGLVGSFEILPRGKGGTTAVDHSWKQTSDGFETAGTVLLNDGKLKQQIHVVSMGKQLIVYEDRVTAVSDVKVRRELGVPIGIENDSISGGTRTLTDKNGEKKMDWSHPQPVVSAGSWANVDGRMGMIMAIGDGVAYAQANKYTAGISVYDDILYGSYSDHIRQFKPGDEVAHRVAILATEISPKETAAIASSYKIETNKNGKVLRFKSPDGGNIEISLQF